MGNPQVKESSVYNTLAHLIESINQMQNALRLGSVLLPLHKELLGVSSLREQAIKEILKLIERVEKVGDVDNPTLTLTVEQIGQLIEQCTTVAIHVQLDVLKQKKQGVSMVEAFGGCYTVELISCRNQRQGKHKWGSSEPCVLFVCQNKKKWILSSHWGGHTIQSRNVVSVLDGFIPVETFEIAMPVN